MRWYWFIMLCVIVVIGIGCREEAEVVPPLLLGDVPESAIETLNEIVSAEPPPSDLVDLSERLRGIEIETPPPHSPTQGTTENFYYLYQTATNREISATLRYQSEHLNMWVAEGAKVSDKELQSAAERLENEILPQTRAVFGEEQQPGIDGDTRLNILHLKEIGSTGEGLGAVGYFFNGDRVPRSANPYSNQRELLYIGLDLAKIGSDNYYSTLTHEYQHLIHDTVDHNEPGWVDEGLAQVAQMINQLPVDSVDSFLDRPDIQLNGWDAGSDATMAHYGASYLFNLYYLDSFGKEELQALVRRDENGFVAYSAELASDNSNLVQFFGRWVAANYLASQKIETEYRSVRLEKSIRTMTHKKFPVVKEASVAQYGTDYIRIQSDSPLTLVFTGSHTTHLLDLPNDQSNYFWSTIAADRSDMTLTREFDLTALNTPTATLQFSAWYDIEKGWDYGYIVVSADGGATWDKLSNIYTTQANLQSGNNYGSGLTGNNVTRDEEIWTEIVSDLTPYIGRKILLRFEYVTDQAVTLDGWAIDNIAIPQLGYSESFDGGDGGWQGAGWVRHNNLLPQTYLLQAIYLDSAEHQLISLPLQNDDSTTFTLDLGQKYDEVILTVSGTTPVTTQRAPYHYEIAPIK